MGSSHSLYRDTVPLNLCPSFSMRLKFSILGAFPEKIINFCQYLLCLKKFRKSELFRGENDPLGLRWVKSSEA
jgi:hypothetical protein